MKISFENVELPSVEGMTSEQKFWFASAIAGMVGADGHAEKHELDYLKQALHFLDSKEDINKIIAMIRDLDHGVTPKLSKIALDGKHTFLILKYLAQIMVADSDLSPKELRFFLQVGNLLGYSGEKSNQNPLFA